MKETNNQYKTVAGESNWDEPTQVSRIYNASDVNAYRGRTFVSNNGSEYKITEDGKFSGRKSIEGAKIMLIAGIENRFYIPVIACLSESYDPKAKSMLDELILKHGQEPKHGLDLVVSLTPESSKEKSRMGMIIPSIKEIK